MHAKNPNGRKAAQSPLPAADSVLSPVVLSAPIVPDIDTDRKLSAAFASALGKNAGAGNGPGAGSGSTKSLPGGSWPGQINKAPKPVGGANSAPPRRGGHR